MDGRTTEAVCAANRPLLRRSSTDTRSPGPPVPLAELLTAERIKVPLESLDKPGILWELSAVLAAASGVPERTPDIHRAVAEREALLSTGVGRGVALPHGKCAALDGPSLAAGSTRMPVAFDALDGQPVQLIVLMAGPASAAAQHVRLLGHISRLLREEGLRQALVAAATADEFHRLIAAAEAT